LSRPLLKTRKSRKRALCCSFQAQFRPKRAAKTFVEQSSRAKLKLKTLKLVTTATRTLRLTKKVKTKPRPRPRPPFKRKLKENPLHNENASE